MFLIATVLLATSFVATPADAAPNKKAQAQEEEEAGPLERRVGFDTELNHPTDLMLQGLTAFETLTFTSPGTWELVADPVLSLDFEHSPQIVADRSSLTVKVNDRSVGTVRLDRENATSGTAEMAIPRHLLKDYNHLTLEVTQHVNTECEDPFDPALWTRVNSTSSLHFTYEQKEVESELLNYPFPLYDPLGYGPARITLIGSENMSPDAIEAIGEVGLSFGRLVGHHTVLVETPAKSLADADTHAMVIGTPADNPLVEQLIEERDLQKGEGLVALLQNPEDPTLAVLVVTGRDSEGLQKAARAVAGQDRYQLLSGPLTKVRTVQEPAPPPNRQLPSVVPEAESFTFGDLGVADKTVRGYYAPPVLVPLVLSGDTVPRIRGSKMQIRFAYGAQLDTSLSTMEVRLNGVVLKSTRLHKDDGDENAVLEVELPPELIEPRTELEILFHLFPRDFDPCRRISDRMIWGSVFASSRIDIRRDHFTMLPDLGLLRFDLFPFTLSPGKGETLLLVSDKPSRAEAAAALQLTTELARVSAHPNPGFKALASMPGLIKANPEYNAILLVSERDHSTYTALTERDALTTEGSLDRTLQRPENQLLGALVETRYGTIEEATHPDNSDRSLLVLRTDTPADLMSVIHLLKDPTSRYRLRGNLAIVGGHQEVRTVSVAERHQVGEEPMEAVLERRLVDSWALLLLMVALAAVLLAGMLRLWATHRGGDA